jgi:toxin YoeB
MKLIWDESAWDDYTWWQLQDRKVVKRINTLIKDVERNCNDGLGKPEPLKHGFHGYWLRRITDEHRLIYKVTDGEIRVAPCRYHYESGMSTATGLFPAPVARRRLPRRS